jgi:hypothetical protein
MRRSITTAIAILGLWSAGQAPPAMAQAVELENSQVVITYVPPTNPNYQDVADRLKARHVLEDLRRFMAPLRLPRQLEIKTSQCGATNAWYEPHGGVIICYEFIDWRSVSPPWTISPPG